MSKVTTVKSLLKSMTDEERLLVLDYLVETLWDDEDIQISIQDLFRMGEDVPRIKKMPSLRVVEKTNIVDLGAYRASKKR